MSDDRLFHIATWNVNSIKAREAHVEQWLLLAKPEILLLQELKGLEFPEARFNALGYRSVSVRQKAYNGVAILSRGGPVSVISERLSDEDTDDQARYLEVDVRGVRILNIYLPNGNPVGTEKFSYKLGWMERLYGRVQTLRRENIPFLIAGDFNVIPEERDCHDPALWREDALFHTETLSMFRKILYLGLTDAFRVQTPTETGHYTFWDYQAGAWNRNAGIRIDHFLLSPEVADKMVSCKIDRTPRGWEKPSDHVPVSLFLDVDVPEEP